MSTHIKTIKGRYEESHGAKFTVNYGESSLDITRFYGGKDNGAMLQLTTYNNHGSSYVQLTQKQVKLLANVLKDSFDYKKYPSE